MFCFRKDILKKYKKLKKSIVEEQEFIEQMTILDNMIDIHSFHIKEATPSINEPKDVGVLKKYLKIQKDN